MDIKNFGQFGLLMILPSFFDTSETVLVNVVSGAVDFVRWRPFTPLLLDVRGNIGGNFLRTIPLIGAISEDAKGRQFPMTRAEADLTLNVQLIVLNMTVLMWPKYSSCWRLNSRITNRRDSAPLSIANRQLPCEAHPSQTFNSRTLQGLQAMSLLQNKVACRVVRGIDPSAVVDANGQLNGAVTVDVAKESCLQTDVFQPEPTSAKTDPTRGG